jgi:hypothetical protein
MSKSGLEKIEITGEAKAEEGQTKPQETPTEEVIEPVKEENKGEE